MTNRFRGPDTNLCILLGLCSAKDAAIVRGSGKLQDKVEFLSTLVELVTLNRANATVNPSANEAFLNDVVADSKAVLSKQIQLFSVDMDPLYASKSSGTQLSDVETRISEAKKELARLERDLSSVDVSGLQVDTSTHVIDIETLKKEVATKLARLETLMKRFETAYQADIAPWCGQHSETTKLYGLGPRAAQLSDLHNSVTQMLSSIKQLKNSYSAIITHDGTIDLAKCDLEISEHLILGVQEQSAVLEKSFSRIHETDLLQA